MKLLCTQENLNKALGMVGRVINKNTTLPILNNVLLKTDKGRLRISSTNLEIGINCWIGGKIKKEGEITVPTRILSSLVTSLPAENIEMELKENDTLSIKCGGYKTDVKGLSAEEYPLIPEIDAQPIFKVSSLEFKNALEQVLPAVSVGEARIEITGIFINPLCLSEGKIVLAATDSYRLAEKTLELGKDSVNKEALDQLGDANSVSIIIPRPAAQELVRNLGDEEEMLEVAISEGQILFRFGNASIISRLIEEKYPDYKQVIPNKFKSEVKVGKSEITNAIKVASLFAGASNNGVELGVFPDSEKLEVSSEAGEIGSNNTKIPAQVSGEKLSVMYNYKYLIDGFNSIVGEDVILKINDESLPTILTSASDKSFMYVIMPIRT